MARTHPHAEAAYTIVTLADGTFGVEVRIPDSFPTTVSNFATEEQAEAWIEQHKNRVQADPGAQRWFRRSGNRSTR
jgi:hypothetical protein